MKIDKSIRDAYFEQEHVNRLISQQMSSLRNKFDDQWHYEARIKSEESFALKVEAGRADQSLTITDFFACTFVVRNSAEISRATSIVEENFLVVDRKPGSPLKTSGRPSEFVFDDLRLYVKLKPGYAGEQPINKVVFEIQIKTFLQHAWGIATHDLTYKTDKVSWAKLRVAYQIRAMLEHAELSIQQFEHLAGSDIIAKEHREYEEVGLLIDAFKLYWDASALPQDLQRLAQSVRSAASLLGASIDEVISYIKLDTDAGKGAKSFDLSPLGAVVQAVLNHHSIDAKKVINAANKRRRREKIMLSRSVSLPDHLQPLAKELISFY